MAFIQNETHFYILRFLLGVAEAGFFPGVIYYFTRWLPGAERRLSERAVLLSRVSLRQIRARLGRRGGVCVRRMVLGQLAVVFTVRLLLGRWRRGGVRR